MIRPSVIALLLPLPLTLLRIILRTLNKALPGWGCIYILLGLLNTAPVCSDSLPDRYLNNPEIGYFGRTNKVLFDANVIDTTIATDMIIRRVFGLMGMRSQIKVYDEREALIKDLSENHIDAIFTSTTDHLHLEHLINPNYLYSLVYGPRAEQKIYLLTKKSDRIRHISQLRGKSISIPSGHHLGRAFLDVSLSEQGLSGIKSFFSDIHETIDTNSAIVDLFFGKADCALVSDIAFQLATELNTQIQHDLEVLTASPFVIPQVIAINKNVPKNILDKVNAYLIQSHDNKHIRYLLSLFRAKKFVKIVPSQLVETKRLLNQHMALKNRPR